MSPQINITSKCVCSKCRLQHMHALELRAPLVTGCASEALLKCYALCLAGVVSKYCNDVEGH